MFYSKYFNRFSKNFVWLVLLQGLGYVFSFISIPILIKKFNYYDSGIIFTTQALVFAIATLSNYSLSFYVPTQSKQISSNKTNFIKLWSIAIWLRIILSLLFGLISVIITYFFYPSFFYFWLFSLSILVAKIINPNLFYNALEKNKKILLIGLLSKGFFIFLLLFITNYIYVNLALGISEFLITIYIIKKDKNSFRVILISINELLNYIKKTISLFLVNVLSLLKPISILPLITFLFGSEYATIYTLADKFINVIRNISGSVYTSFYPIFNKENLKHSIISKQNIFFSLSFSLLIVLFFWNFAPFLVYTLNNFNYNKNASEVLQTLSLSIPVFFMIIPFFSLFLELKKWNYIILFAFIQLLFLIIFLLFYHKNLNDIAYGFVLSEYVMLIFYTIMTYKIVR